MKSIKKIIYNPLFKNNLSIGNKFFLIGILFLPFTKTLTPRTFVHRKLIVDDHKFDNLTTKLLVKNFFAGMPLLYIFLLIKNVMDL